MAHADENRTDVASRSNGGTDLKVVFRIKHRHTRTAFFRDRVPFALSIKQFFGNARGWSVQQDAQVRREAAPPRMCESVSVPQHQIRWCN